MEFLGIGFGEMLLLFILALIIWGPGKLVDIARTIGKISRNLSKASSDLKDKINEELEQKEKDSPPKRTAAHE